jgi:hypothetical protein
MLCRMDYKFIVTLVLNVAGLGFMAWQIRIMKRQMENLPSERSARKIALERKLSRKLYLPVFLMAGLILLSWLPFVVRAYQPSPLPAFVVGWSGATDGCNAAIDTSGFVKAAEKYRMFLVCYISDPSIDQMDDEKISMNKPFLITGRIVPILLTYGPSAPIREVAKLGSQTNIIVVLLPKDQDGSRIKRLSDINREGGQILVPGGKLRD